MDRIFQPRRIESSGRSVKTTAQVFPASATVITTVDDSATKESGVAAIIDSVATEIDGYLQTVQRAGTAKSETYAYDDYGQVKQYTDIRGGSTCPVLQGGAPRLRSAFGNGLRHSAWLAK